jgi:hypothetical protein
LYAELADKESITLDAEGVYWLVVEPESPFSELTFAWFGNKEGVKTGYYANKTYSNGSWSGWTSSGLQSTVPAFAINGPVPIPEPAGGLLIGLFGLVCGLRRRRRA